MARREVIFGIAISEPGNYEFCWLTYGEDGMLVRNSRNVVITQHGPFFYFRWANENFVEYPCGHEGIRCDLLDTNSWFCPVGGQVLGDDDLIQPGDEWLLPGGTPTAIESEWYGVPVARYRMAFEGRYQCTVIRPASDFEQPTAVNGATVGSPGLQAAR